MKRINQVTLLLNVDSAAGQAGQPEEADPLAMPASSANTDYPLLKAGKIVRFSVSKMELVDAKKDDAPEGAQNLKISLATENEERSSTDEVLHKGFTVSKYIPLYASGDRKAADIQRDVGTFIKACEGKSSTTDMRTVRTNPDHFIGKIVDAKVGIQEDKTGKYGPSNQVRFVIPGQ